MNGLGRLRMVIGFGLCGLSSVFLLSACLHVPLVAKWTPFLLVGTVFGVCMTACFRAYLNLRLAWRMPLFVAGCVVGFYLSLSVVQFAYSHMLASSFSSKASWGPGPSAFFVGGAVGGFVVLTSSFLLFFHEQPLWRLLLKSISWSLIGGVLGAVGGALDTSFSTARGAWWSPFGHELPLFFIWQTGMGLVLGSVLECERRFAQVHRLEDGSFEPPTRKPSRTVTFAGSLFFAAILILLPYFVMWEVCGSYALSTTR